MSVYKKLTKKQLKILLENRDTQIKELEEKLRDIGVLEDSEKQIKELEEKLRGLEVDDEKKLEETKTEVPLSVYDKERLRFCKERINNSIHKDLVSIFEKEIRRIENIQSPKINFFKTGA